MPSIVCIGFKPVESQSRLYQTNDSVNVAIQAKHTSDNNLESKSFKVRIPN